MVVASRGDLSREGTDVGASTRGEEVPPASARIRGEERRIAGGRRQIQNKNRTKKRERSVFLVVVGD